MGRFEELSWRLLEHKLMYYNPEKVHSSWHPLLTVEDSVYDSLENEYNELAEKQGACKSVTQMVDFDFSRPSCKMVMKKLGREST